MGRKVLLFIAVILNLSVVGYAQSNKNTAIVKGKLINAATKTPFNDLKVAIPALSVFATSDGNGNFTISEVPHGSQSIVISNYNIKTDSLSVSVTGTVTDMGDILITPNDLGASEQKDEIPTITIESNTNTSNEDDGVTSQSAEGIAGGHDNFLRYIFGLASVYNFKYRGYTGSHHETQINGISLSDIELDRTSSNQFGRFYDQARVRDQVYGLAPSAYAFGNKTGTEYRDATAANQGEETKIGYIMTDRPNNNGITASHSSGLSKDGWAYSVAFAKRWQENGYVPGTFYNDYAYYAAASKVIGKGTLNLTTFGDAIDHGKKAAATEEAYNLDGSKYYNHDWGMYDGQIRNARVEKEFRPLTILNYEYKPDDKTRWNTAMGYEFGKDKNSTLDGYNASDPYGDYYRNLPSYYLTMAPPNTTAAAIVKSNILSNPEQALQIDWNRMYQDNYQNTQTLYNVNGIAGNNYTNLQSEYVIGNVVNDLKKFSFNTNLEHSVNEHLTVDGGLSVVAQSTENYKQVEDLLGGNYFVNYNQFASQQAVTNPNYYQNDLNHPNAVIKTGDKYGYDYTINERTTLLWGQAVYNLNKFDFFAAVNAGGNMFNREGFMKNGLFPENSYGTAAWQYFLTYGVKAGASYKIDTRNVIYLNVSYTTTPPTPDNTYISANTRDFTVGSPSVQKNQMMELGYIVRANKLSGRITGYATDAKNVTEIKRFYNDDPAYNTFVNYVMTGENTRNIGAEIALQYKLLPQFSIIGIGSIGQAFYANNPNIAVYLDNDPLQAATTSKTYIKNYYLPAGPQTTGVLGLEYRRKRDMYIDLNFNYFDRNYVEINPNRRTTAATGLYAAGSPQWHEIFDQEELPSAFTVDLKAGKTFDLSRSSKRINKFSRNTVLRVSANIANLLNNTNIIGSGYEQFRYDFINDNPGKFPNKYTYAMGINYSVSVSLSF